MDGGTALLGATAIAVGSLLINVALVFIVRDMRKDVARVARAASRASRTAEAELATIEELLAELEERRRPTTLPAGS